jgi:hypothetical protein
MSSTVLETRKPVAGNSSLSESYGLANAPRQSYSLRGLGGAVASVVLATGLLGTPVIPSGPTYSNVVADVRVTSESNPVKPRRLTLREARRLARLAAERALQRRELLAIAEADRDEWLDS